MSLAEEFMYDTRAIGFALAFNKSKRAPGQNKMRTLERREEEN